MHRGPEAEETREFMELSDVLRAFDVPTQALHSERNNWWENVFVGVCALKFFSVTFMPLRPIAKHSVLRCTCLPLSGILLSMRDMPAN